MSPPGLRRSCLPLRHGKPLREHVLSWPGGVGVRTAVLARHLLRQRQTKPTALRTPGYQRQEQTFGQVLGHAAAVVDDVQAQRQGVQFIADAYAVLGAGAQLHAGGAGFDRIAHQVPGRLGQAVDIAQHVRQARVVIAHQLHRPARIGLGQPQHALEHDVDVERRVRLRRLRRKQAIEQQGQASDLGFDQAGEFGRLGIVAMASCEQLRRALEPGQGIAQFVRQPPERGRQRRRQGERGVLAGELVDRVRLQQPAAELGPGEPGVGEARLAAQVGQRNPAQPERVVASGAGNRAAQQFAAVLQRGQGLAGQPARADPEPACEGGIAPLDMAMGIRPHHRGGQLVEFREAIHGHCTKLVQSPCRRQLNGHRDRSVHAGPAGPAHRRPPADRRRHRARGSGDGRRARPPPGRPAGSPARAWRARDRIRPAGR